MQLCFALVSMSFYVDSRLSRSMLMHKNDMLRVAVFRFIASPYFAVNVASCWNFFCLLTLSIAKNNDHAS